MSIATEITRLQDAKDAVKTAIEGKGVTVPTDTLLDGYASLIGSISGLPSAITKISAGTFIPASNQTSWTAPHDLGEAADYFLVIDRTSLSNSSNTILNGTIAMFGFKKIFQSYPASGIARYGSVSGVHYTSSAVSLVSAILSTSTMQNAVFGISSCCFDDYNASTVFLSGHTYFWLAGKHA